MKKISIIGTGYVGLVTGTCFSELGNQVICCDIDPLKINKLIHGVIPFFEPKLEEMVKRNVEERRLSFTTDIAHAIKVSDIIIIAVGTPLSDNGEADLRYVVDTACLISANLNSYKVIVNKSTVPVGTGKLVQKIIMENKSDESVGFDVVSNPEFLREGSAVNDFMKMERVVIGGTSEKALSIIKELYLPFNTNIFMTTPESAEMIKYAANAFLATKISFINEIANICERVGADVTDVAEGIGLDSRIGKKFLQAGIGYGGSCLPKDTSALIQIANKVNYDFKLLKSVIEINNQQRELILERVKDALGTNILNKKIAVLGLAFKPNTDDIRNAPSLTVIPELLRMGANVNAFDPIAIHEAKKELSEKVSYFTDIYKAIYGADLCLILTEWTEILELDLEIAAKLMNQPIIVDGRNCYSLDKVRQLGFTYYSIGRSFVEKDIN